MNRSNTNTASTIEQNPIGIISGPPLRITCSKRLDATICALESADGGLVAGVSVAGISNPLAGISPKFCRADAVDGPATKCIARNNVRHAPRIDLPRFIANASFQFRALSLASKASQALFGLLAKLAGGISLNQLVVKPSRVFPIAQMLLAFSCLQ
jgi:hypothetical protein